MKKLSIGIVIVLVAVLAFTASVSAAGLAPASGVNSTVQAKPYEGTFSGYVNGDNGSRAPITLTLRQNGEVLDGNVSVGDGLYVDGGVCGGTNIPVTQQKVTGETLLDKPDQVLTQLTFTVSNLKIEVHLESVVSDDGKTITAKATIDLPWFCGRTPVLSGELTRIQYAIESL